MDPSSEFALPEGPYLLSHSVGCLPHKARSSLETRFLAAWATEGGDAWPQWIGILEDFRRNVAKLIGGTFEGICPQPSVSAAFFNILTALPGKSGRRKVLMHADAFPTMGFVIKGLKQRGFELEIIDRDLPANDPATWQKHLGPQTAAALITHVHSNTGVVSPVKEIAALCREAGAYSIVDIAQSVSVVPISASDWNADAIVGSCVKWSCGGPGAGYLWIRSEFLNQMQPEQIGWFSHANPFEFDIRHFEYAEDAKRFLGGTPSVAPFALAAGAIETILDIGVPQIQAHNKHLQAIACEGLPSALRPSLEGIGGTLCLDLSNAKADRLEHLLGEEGYRFDRRGDALRLSFHIYNTESQASLVRDCIDKALDAR